MIFLSFGFMPPLMFFCCMVYRESLKGFSGIYNSAWIFTLEISSLPGYAGETSEGLRDVYCGLFCLHWRDEGVESLTKASCIQNVN